MTARDPSVGSEGSANRSLAVAAQRELLAANVQFRAATARERSRHGRFTDLPRLAKALSMDQCITPGAAEEADAHHKMPPLIAHELQILRCADYVVDGRRIGPVQEIIHPAP
jgi:hypothetical protein